MNNTTSQETKNIKETTNMNISTYNVFSPMTYSNSINQIISGICLLYWIILMVYVYYILVKDNKKEIFSLKSRLGFLPYFVIIALYPIIYFVNQIIRNTIGGTEGRLDNLSADYSVCYKNHSQLTQKEKDLGAIGKANYKCLKDMNNFTNDYGDMITRRTFYITHGLFALTLFLFTQRAGKFKNTIVSSHSYFITELMRNALFIALLLMTCSTFLGYYYITTYFLFAYMNLLQMLGSLTIMIISFILYRLIYLYV